VRLLLGESSSPAEKPDIEAFLDDDGLGVLELM
jgi:hypothetical protein